MNEKLDEETRKRNKDVANLLSQLKQKDEEINKQKIELIRKDKKIGELQNQLQTFLPAAQLCTVKEFPNQVFANKDESFVIMVKNCYGKNISNCKDYLGITIINQNGTQEKKVSFSINESESGHYNVSFVIKRIGDYVFSVLVNGCDIHDFPQKYVTLKHIFYVHNVQYVCNYMHV